MSGWALLHRGKLPPDPLFIWCDMSAHEPTTNRYTPSRRNNCHRFTTPHMHLWAITLEHISKAPKVKLQRIAICHKFSTSTNLGRGAGADVFGGP